MKKWQLMFLRPERLVNDIITCFVGYNSTFNAEI